MPPNRYPRAELLEEIDRLKVELGEEQCRRRAERLYRQASPEGRRATVERLRRQRTGAPANPLESPPTE